MGCQKQFLPCIFRAKFALAFATCRLSWTLIKANWKRLNGKKEERNSNFYLDKNPSGPIIRSCNVALLFKLIEKNWGYLVWIMAMVTKIEDRNILFDRWILCNNDSYNIGMNIHNGHLSMPKWRAQRKNRLYLIIAEPCSAKIGIGCWFK